MKYTVSALLLGLLTPFLLISPGQAQSTNTLLWKIEGKGIQPSYVFGTIHLLPQDDFQLHKKVENAFMESDMLVLELDMDDPGLQGEVMQHAAMKDGQTLDALFSEEDYATLDAELKATMGVGVAPFNTIKPFMVAAFLMAKYAGGQPASFESALIQMAQSQEKPIEGLETVAEQMSFFDRIPYEEQAEDIVEMLNEEEKTRAMFQKLVSMYKTEDTEALAAMMHEYFDDPAEVELLLNARNKKWIPVIEAKAQRAATFFGVGAGHLGGPEGILALLKQAGFTVTPVP